MAPATVKTHLQEFAEFVKFDEPLAACTYLKLGGRADALAQPRSVPELCAVVRRCGEHQLPLRVLGSGCAVLVPDEGVRGVVLRLREPAFTQIEVQGKRARAGSGATLAALISHTAQQGLTGLETMVGIPGTVGGALRQQAGDRGGDIGQYLRTATVVDATGTVQQRQHDELRLSYDWSNPDDPVAVAAEFELDADNADSIVKRMRKAWIQRKAGRPFSYQAACRVFKNPRGLSAAALVQQAGLAGTKVGGAEVSERDANYIIPHDGATARDVLRLIDLIRSRVQERFHVELELELSVW